MIVGIDLGTTHSLISVWKEGKPLLVPNGNGEVMTPSVVGVDGDGNVVVGEAARLCPDAITNFKRYMGTNKVFRMGKESFRPEELSALILKGLIHDAEVFTGEKVTEAVLTVPAYFNNNQRKATHLAGQLAGLSVERLINEPTAAALSYGIHQKDEETTFLVFDLGGGTFDVSIVELFSGIIEVRSSAGDNFLGGEDFSGVLEGMIRAKIWEEHQIDPEKLSSEGRFILRRAAHDLKHALSVEEEACSVFELEGKKIEIPYSRKNFEIYSRPLLDRLRGPLEKALSDARIRPAELNAVILVGGATRMPLIQSEIAKMLGHFPNSSVHPDEAVGLGAGIQAALKERHEDVKDVVVTDVCPFSLGTAIVQKYSSKTRFLPIIERNTTIPTSRTERLSTASDNQVKMNIDVYQGESFHLDENIKIGEFSVTVPSAPRGVEDVDVRYSYDANGLLEVEATVLSTKETKKNCDPKSGPRAL